MAAQKKSVCKKTSEPRAQHVIFSVEPSTQVEITLDVGEEVVDGEKTELSFDLPAAIQVQVLRVGVLDLHASDQAKVHIWEVQLR